jgi:hypothetical protein
MINYSERELIVHNFDHASEIRVYIDEDLVGTIYLEDGRWGPSGVESSGSKREAIASLLHWHGLDCPNIMTQLDELVPQDESTPKDLHTAFGQRDTRVYFTDGESEEIVGVRLEEGGEVIGTIKENNEMLQGHFITSKGFDVYVSRRSLGGIVYWLISKASAKAIAELEKNGKTVNQLKQKTDGAISELEQIDCTADDELAPSSNPESKIITVLLKKEENDVIEIYLEMKTRNAYAGLIRKRRDTYPWDGFNSDSIEITSNWATRLEAIQSLLAKSHVWEDRFKVTIEEQLNAFAFSQPQRRSLDFATAEPGQAIVIEFSGNDLIKDQSIKTTICSVHSEGGDHTGLVDLKGITLSCHRSGGWARLSNNMRVFEEGGLVLLTGDVKTEDGKEELDFQCNVYPL